MDLFDWKKRRAGEDDATYERRCRVDLFDWWKPRPGEDHATFERRVNARQHEGSTRRALELARETPNETAEIRALVHRLLAPRGSGGGAR